MNHLGAIQKLHNCQIEEGVDDFDTYCYIYLRGRGYFMNSKLTAETHLTHQDTFYEQLHNDRNSSNSSDTHLISLVRYGIIKRKSIDKNLEIRYLLIYCLYCQHVLGIVGANMNEKAVLKCRLSRLLGSFIDVLESRSVNCKQ